jgi:hypothetical protein
MEYESVTQKVLFSIEQILQKAKQLQHAQSYFVVPGSKIIGHGNPDSNLESSCIILQYFSERPNGSFRNWKNFKEYGEN